MVHRPFNICEHCGKPKTKWQSHEKCSKALQSKYKGKPRPHKSAVSRGRRTLPATSIDHLSKTGGE